MAQFFIGTSGWHYEHWRDIFYPVKLPKSRWLGYYSSRFSTVELNNSFYRLPSEKAFKNWRESSPEGFVFAVKASRFITHIKRLKDSGEAVENFVNRAAGLGDRLGPILYQLPPGFHRDDTRLSSFLATLPRGYMHVFEFRHDSWLEEEVFQILAKYKAGFCIFDMPSLTTPVTATADFAYVRFHGSEELYATGYSNEALADWADKISSLAEGLDRAYIYFNNDAQGFAVKNAMTLRGYLQGRQS